MKDLSWLGDAREICHPLSQNRPLWVQETRVANARSQLMPMEPEGEWHPYCELSYNFEGRITQCVGAEMAEREAGDLMLLGSNVPHRTTLYGFPQWQVSVFFPATFLFEMAPEQDGVRLLSRFQNCRTVEDWLVRPPGAVRRRVRECFERLAAEARSRRIGGELRMRALLLEILGEILAWDHPGDAHGAETEAQTGWSHLHKALAHIREHFAEPVYIAQLARVAGTNESRLTALFKANLGMSWLQYLRGYRIAQAAAMLAQGGARVTEVALSVGFETLSHFNTSFRSFTGVTPTEHMRGEVRGGRRDGGAVLIEARTRFSPELPAEMRCAR
ncbi:MAG TPA: AraC family transcriptional regulator [Opitutaceae bacterium]|nr:AraC family transcriptional regulator [Opitutaceae bacterium]